MNRIRSIIASSLLVLTLAVSAQDTLYLDERAYLKTVWTNAPYIQGKLLKFDLAEVELDAARAAFQPMLGSMYEQKRFDDKLYYSRSLSEVSVQTPWALKLAGGFNQTRGDQLNPEALLPERGLNYLSFELPLGGGLFTDKNRTGMKLARLGVNGAQLQVWMDVNKYLFEAGKTYWKWYESVLLSSLAEEARSVTRDRLDFVKAKQAIGEYAAIDTLEALINLQNREAFFNEQLINRKQRSREVAVTMGLERMPTMNPVVDLDLVPQVPDSSWSQQLVETHPMTRLFEVEQMQAEAKERLAREYFKPQVNLKYSLQQDVTDPFISSYDPNENQYFGLQFNFPVLLRAERARARKWELKQDVVQWEKSTFTIGLNGAMSANRDVRTTLDSNRVLWQQAAVNYGSLLAAEQRRFFIGESNNFLLNRREIQWLETRKKYIKSYVEFRINVLEYYYLSALLPQLVGMEQ